MKTYSEHHPIPLTVHVLPGETITQALIRHGVLVPAKGAVTIPPGTYTGSNLRQTRIIERRTTGIPFLNPGDHDG
jgi:hypothetical protein